MEHISANLFNDTDLAERRAQILKALGHPHRLRIVAFLADCDECTVGELCDALGLTQSVVSHQLASLRLHHLVRRRKEGGFRWYSLAIPELSDLVACILGCRREFPTG